MSLGINLFIDRIKNFIEKKQLDNLVLTFVVT